MQLSERMRRLTCLVTEGNRLADVGTDHGYVPIALVKAGRIPSAVAMDVNRGPLARARAHIREYGLSTYIETRLSDGLAQLEPGEAETVMIAGMGGMLTIRILENGAHCLDTVQELVLQPQSDIRRVREWLRNHGRLTTAEDIVEEDGKYYPMLKAVRGRERPLTEADLCYGKAEVQRSPETLRRYLQAGLAENRKILETLRAHGRAGTDRGLQVAEQIDRLTAVLAETVRPDAGGAVKGGCSYNEMQ